MASSAKISKILSEFPKGDTSKLIPAMQAIQEEYGWLSEDNLTKLSSYLEVSPAKAYGVATFYAQFRLEPMGRHLINLCTGTACHVKGADRLIPLFEQELGIKVGETTSDGKFTLETVACLGCCSLSPAVNIDEDYYGNVKRKDIKKILRKYD